MQQIKFRKLCIIFITFTYIDQEMFLNLYNSKSLIRSHLEYANPVWTPCLKSMK